MGTNHQSQKHKMYGYYPSGGLNLSKYYASLRVALDFQYHEHPVQIHCHKPRHIAASHSNDKVALARGFLSSSTSNIIEFPVPDVSSAFS
jgi:hypothetical protein